MATFHVRVRNKTEYLGLSSASFYVLIFEYLALLLTSKQSFENIMNIY